MLSRNLSGNGNRNVILAFVLVLAALATAAVASPWSTGLGLFASSSVAASDGEAPLVVLYDQINNPAPTPGGVTSQDFEAANDTFDTFAADDFVVPAGQTWSITEVDVSGEYSVGGGPAASFNVFFYQDSATLPGTLVATRLANPFTGGANAIITLTTPVVLTPGTYWVSVQTRQDFTPAGQWFWDNRSVISNSGAAWQNPGNGFGTGCTTYGRKTTCLPTTNGPDELFRIVGTIAGGATPTPSPSPTCPPNYTFTSSNGVAIVPGTTDTGNHVDDGTTTIALPFQYQFYDQLYTAVNISSNGNLQFVSNSNSLANACPMPDVAFNYAIMPHWDDLRTDQVGTGCTAYGGVGCGVFTSTTGTAPNRIFNIEWRTVYFGANTTRANFEARIYEGQRRVDFVYGEMAQGGSSSTEGVQRSTGTQFTQYACNTAGSLTSGQQLAFTATGGTCASPTPSPTATPTATPTPTPTASPVVSPTPTPGCTFRVLLAHSDTASPPTTLRNQILAEPGVTAVDIFDAFTGTPTLAQLQQYNIVVAFSNNSYSDATAMGNVLADYADTGGTVVALNFDWFGPPFGLAGRWMTGGYTPFNDAAPTNFNSSCLGTFNAGHPLMQGVPAGSLCAFFRHTMTLSAGAVSVASYADNQQEVAYKTNNGHTGVGINAYLGANPENFTGNYGHVIVNAGRWLGGNCGTPTPTPAASPTPTPPVPTPTPTRTPTPTPTATPSPSASPSPCTQYAVSQIGGAIVPGTTDIGNHGDDTVTTIALPFSYALYDQAFTSINLSSNGNAQFVTTDTTFSNVCLPWLTHNYTIFPYWDDLYLVNAGFGIFTSVSGTAPNRIFNIEWRAQYFPGSGSAPFELRLYEGQTRFDVIYGATTNGNTSATAGVQKNDTTFTQYFCNGVGGAATGGQSYILQGAGCQPTPTPVVTPTPTPTRTPTPTPVSSPSPTCNPTFRVLIVHADTTAPTQLQSEVLAEPGVTAADFFDAQAGTPTLAQLQAYNIVVPFSNFPFLDADTLGNNLADYVDGGGVVVQYGFSHYGPAQPYGVNGRWLTGNYNPYAYSANLNFAAFTLGTFNAGHPLMAGVTTLNSDFQNIVTPAAGATQVAAANNGNSLVAYRPVSGGHTTVGVTAYVGSDATQTGHWGRVIVNAGRWLLGAGCASPSPSVSPTRTPTPTPTVTPVVTPTPACSPGLPGAWTNKAVYPFTTYGTAVATEGTFAYAFGGNTIGGSQHAESNRYNATTNAWNALAPMTAGPDYLFHAEYGANGKIYVMGGLTGGTLNRIYDIATNAWTAGAPVPVAVYDHGHAYNAGQIYVIGGIVGGVANNAVNAYNVATNTWTARANLPVAKFNMACGVISGKIYCAGGSTGSNQITDLDVYDIAANTWSAGPPMTTAANFPAGTVVNGKLWVIGGGNPFAGPESPEQPESFNNTQIYDPVANSWSAGPNLIQARSFADAVTLNVTGGQMALVVAGYNSTVASSIDSVEGSLTVTSCGTPTPTPVVTPTPTPTRTPTPTPTPTRTPTPTPTPTPVVTPTPTVTPTPVTSVQFSSSTYIDDESNTATITVTRTGPLGGTSTVQYATSNGTATGGTACTANVDYITAAGTLTFAPTVASQTFGVVLCADNITEFPDQTVNLALMNPTGAVLGTPNTAVLTVNDTATQFENQTPIVINSGAAGNPYPSTILVQNGPTVIGSMRITLYDLTTTRPDNLGVLLVGPLGQKFILMADAGGFTPITGQGVTLNIVDTAGQVMPDNGPLATADYEPTNWVPGVPSFPPPAPPAPYREPGSSVGGTGTQTLFGNYGGTNSNGIWSLYVRDNGTPGSPETVIGQFANGWGLEFFAPTAAQASISGRVTTAEGLPIRNARVTIAGQSLPEPRVFTTGSFGYFSFDGLTVGETYVVTVNSQRYTFQVPNRVISLVDNVFDADFVAEPNP